MNTLSRTITGIIMSAGGLMLIVFSFFNLFFLFYGAPLLIVGLFILFNKNEDKIEEINDSYSLESKKFKKKKVKVKGGEKND